MGGSAQYALPLDGWAKRFRCMPIMSMAIPLIIKLIILDGCALIVTSSCRHGALKIKGVVGIIVESDTLKEKVVNAPNA